MFGRKKKNEENQATVAGLPAVTVSVADSTQDPASSTSPAAGSTPPPAGSTPPPQSSVFPLNARTSMAVDTGSTVIDARNVPGLRDELLDVISHGGNPAEIQDIVMKAMSQGHALTGMTPLGAGSLTPPPPAAEDPLDRLQKLNDLRVSGALTDAEFEAQKAKILGEM